MPRRIRFTPRLWAGVFVAAVAAAGGSLPASDVPFTARPPVTTSADGAQAVFAADLDGDGDLDLVGASSLDDKVAWYENAAGDATAWTTHTITTAALGARGVSAADLDRDGDVDVLSASPNDGKLAWYENTSGDGSAWTAHAIATAPGAGALAAADLDHDGDTDVVWGSLAPGGAGWYENADGAGGTWTLHTIITQPLDAGSVAAADLDGDGDLDVLLAAGFGATVAWFENVGGAGTSWTPHLVSTALYDARAARAADLDGDGDLDVLAATEIPGVLWYENAGGGSGWTAHVVSAGAAEDAFPADLDQDGDLDAVSPAAGSLRWHENGSGDGSVWVTRTVSTAAAGTYHALAADLDGDGDPDLLRSSAPADGVFWHRNETIHRSACFAAPAAITTGALSAVSVASGDVDGDGDTDVLSASQTDDKVAWYENLGGGGGAWTTHTITTAADVAMAVTPADVDGDGHLDAFSAGYYSGIRWYENSAGDGSAWNTTSVLFGSPLAVGAADVDGDGDVDALSTTSFFDNQVKWVENLAGDGSAWTARPIATLGAAGPSYSVTAADLDGDGDTDVLGSLYFAGTLWFENGAGNGSAWTTRTIHLGRDVSVAVGDVDGDGDLDALAGGASLLSWEENLAGNGSSWTSHAVANGVSSRAVRAADLDGDGDLDVLRAGAGASNFSWHENLTGTGSSWTAHPLPDGATGRDVAAADVDGDGDLDVLTASDSRVSWHENRGGQASLAASDASPGSAMNSELVPLLRLDVAHLGRPGDSDLELASLGLLFEESPGVPLTSAQANALVESLRLYRDADGNGGFDPGSDVLVASLPDLVLSGGVQAFALPDGDPQLQVALGAPRSYFVVAELTADASGQSPNQFRITHLGTGPLASVAEDRGFDIPLRLACPVDVSAGVGPITPVELLGLTIE